MTENEIQLEEVERPIKRTTGDTLEERLTGNAYNNILPQRYLRENEVGEMVEDQENLFERVSKNVALAEVVYKSDELDVEVMVGPHQVHQNKTNRDEVVSEIFDTTGALNDDGELFVEDDSVEVELTEKNVYNFSYDLVVPRLKNEEVREHVEDIQEEFQEMMEHLRFMPNSPTLMNAGDHLQQLSACFVISPDDDMDSIHQTAKEAASTFQSGGGMGYGFWDLRPKGDPVGGTGGVASGPITFMRTYDQMCETVAQGGQRRGAQMGVMRVSHPDVLQFIHAKNKDVSLAHTLRLNDPDDYTHNSFGEALEEARELIDDEGKVPEHLRNAVEGHLSNFNISVGITDSFMESVKNDEMHTFTNPRTGEPHRATEGTKELYEMFGLGEYVEVGEVLSVPANELWDRIIEGAHENGEPGVIYLERANKKHSFDVEENPEYRMRATNPCGEQPLLESEACNLGHINLSTVVDEGATDWRVWSDEHLEEYDSVRDAVDAYMRENIDIDEFDYRIEKGTRFLENVVTMSEFPVESISETVRKNRKIGLGIMGLAQMYVQLGVKYGEDVSNEMARWTMRHINHGSKSVSNELAGSRGVFENWEDSKYADPTEYTEWFEDHTGEDAEEWADGYPIRNHNTTTIAPTGTTSMVGNTTGGCEPIYNVAYYKNVSGDVQGDEMLVEFDDYFLRTLKANGLDVDAIKEEAQEQMSNNEFDGINGLDRVPDALGELFVTTGDLSAKQHAAIQCACQDGVDSAISKTINAPNDAEISDAREAFEFAYDNGAKGVTYYRDGTRSKQVLTTRADNSDFSDRDAEEVVEDVIDLAEDNDELRESLEQEFGSVKSEAEYLETGERPNKLPGSSQRIKTGYGKVYVTINVDANENPVELFANIGQSGGYTNSFTEALAKVISIALRSGVDPEEITDELVGTRSPKLGWDNGEQIHSIPDAIGRALRRDLNDNIPEDKEQQESQSDDKSGGDAVNDLLAAGESPECPECSSMSLNYSEGCKTCESCGWSEC
jgi:ribonucleoside-diphosphate reductase alpha chain